MGFKIISVKISEELLEEIRREAQIKQVCFSETIRQRMNQSGSQAAALFQFTARIDQLEQQISAISMDVAGQQESLTHLTASTRSITESLSRLIALLDEEKKFPFGMNRNFVQVATMAGFTLARGTFSNSPEAWEPYKEEARHRAFKNEGDEP